METASTPNPPERPARRGKRRRAGGRSDDDRALAERLLAAARAGGDVRRRKVRRLRAAIKVRVYENELKMTIAFERLLKLAAKPPLKLKRQSDAAPDAHPEPAAPRAPRS